MHSTTAPFAVPLPAEAPFAFSLHALTDHLTTLVDQRKPCGLRYPLVPLLTIAILAKLSGHSRVAAIADWPRSRCSLHNIDLVAT